MFRNPFRKKKRLRKGQLVRPSMNLKPYERMRKINRLLGRIELTNSTGLISLKGQLIPFQKEYWF